MPEDLKPEASRLLQQLRDRNLTLVTAESCTGGLISAALTEIPGSSEVVERGFVTYSNRAKTEMLGVPAGMIEQYGAVSEQVANAMASGALERCPADVAVAVTGIAGPGGGSEEKPVGLVHIAAARRGGAVKHLRCEFGEIGRSAVRERTALEAFKAVDFLL